MTNNYRILENIKDTLRMVREQLDSENKVINRYHFTSILINDIADRLDVGAERYGVEVPIEISDGRDMGVEAYEELCDAVVYLSSLTLRLKTYRRDKNEPEEKYEIDTYSIVAINSVLFNTLYQLIIFLEAYDVENR